MKQDFLARVTTPQAAQAAIGDWFRYSLAHHGSAATETLSDRDLFDLIKKLQNAPIDLLDHYYEALSTAQKKRAGEIWLVWEFCTQQVMGKAHRNAIQERQASEDYPGQTIKGALQRAAQNGATKEELQGVLLSAIALSLTAHPTQYLPPEYVNIRQRLAEALQKGDRDQSGELLKALLNISPTDLAKKTPAEEFALILCHAEQIFQVMPGLLREVDNTLDVLADRYPERDYGSLRDIASRHMHGILPRFWAGVDRDGNPAITADVSASCMAESHRFIGELYVRELENIRAQAVHKGMIDALIKDFRNGVFAYAQDADLIKFRHRLTDLKLHENGEPLDAIRDLEQRARLFGWNLGKFQPRQEAGIHAQGVTLLMPEYAEIEDEEKKLAALSETLDRLGKLSKADLAAEQSRILAKLAEKKGPLYDTIKSLELVRDNPDAFCDYIISNTDNASDVLELMVLLRLMGVEDKINIRPLCESRADLENMPGMFQSLLANPHYRGFVKKHGGRILMMIALSDTQRQDGPAVIFDQHLTPLNVINKIQTLCQQQGFTVDIMDGGSDDIYRGGGDLSMYPFHLARNLVGYAAKTGKEISDFVKCLGHEFALTIQNRQIESEMGNPTSAARFLERMVAMRINFSSFLKNELPQGEIQECRQEYEANEKARNLLAPCIAYFHHFRGPTLDELSVAVIPSAAATVLNTGARPDKRPKLLGDNGEELDLKDVHTLKLTDTRAITNQFAVELPGLEINGWLSLRALRQIPLAERNQLMDQSPLMREMLQRAMLCLARADFDESWFFLELPVVDAENTVTHKKVALQKPDPATALAYAEVFDEAFQASLARGEREQFDYQKEIGPILEKLGLDSTGEAGRLNGWLVQMCWLEQEFKQTQSIVCETMLGQRWGAKVSARELQGLFERVDGEETIKRQMVKPMRHWLARLNQQFKWQEVKRDNQNADECLLQQLAQCVIEGNKTPPSYSNHTPGHEADLRKLRRCAQHLARQFDKTIAGEDGFYMTETINDNYRAKGISGIIVSMRAAMQTGNGKTNNPVLVA